jgi:hypothetical protein
MEIETTDDADVPVRMWPVDGATIALDAAWHGDAEQPRYLQTVLGAARVFRCWIAN